MICYLFVGLKILLPNKPSIGGTAALLKHIAKSQAIPIFIIIF